MTPYILLVIAVLIQIAPTVVVGVEFAREGDLASAKVAAIFVGLGLVAVIFTLTSAVLL